MPRLRSSCAKCFRSSPQSRLQFLSHTHCYYVNRANAEMDEGIWTHGSIKISHIPERQCSSEGRHSKPPIPLATPTDAIASVSKPVMSGRPITCHNDCPKRVTSWLGWSWSMRGELLQGGHCASEIAALQLYTALTTKNSRHWRGTPLSYLRQRIQMAKDDRQQWWFGTAHATHAKQAGPTHQ